MANPGCTPGTAKTEGWQWFAKPCIKAEINRLNRIKREKMLETVAGDEAQVFQMMWDITFSDMADFAEWGQYEQQIMTMYGPLFETNEETGEKSPVTKMVNDVRFVDSAQVDGTLVAEVKKGKDGAGIKLASKDKALAWLLDYFELNPSDVHRREFDKRRLELESLKIATAQGGTEQPATDDGFLAALDSEAGQMWNGDTPDDSREEWKADDELDTG